MENFNRTEAIDYITDQILSENPAFDQEQCRSLVEKIMNTDFEFMEHSGVIVDGHFSDDAYYEDDEAFSYVAERIFTDTQQDEQFLMDLLEGYFDHFEGYMAKCNLLSWD